MDIRSQMLYMSIGKIVLVLAFVLKLMGLQIWAAVGGTAQLSV